MVRDLERVILESVQDSISGLKRPFGLFLSGGVDSGLLAALTRPDVVFTARFPDSGPRYDEFEYAKATAEHLGLKQVVVDITKEDFEKYLPEALKLYHPTTHYSLVPLYLLFKKAQELGIKTILSGEGPDEYLGGYASYSILMAIQNLYKQKELKNYHPLLDSFFGEPIEQFARIINKSVRDVEPYWDRYEHLLSKIGYADLKVRGIEEMELALAKGLSIELLYPYMTDEVQEYCFRRVKDTQKVKGLTTKYCFKKIAEKYLPKEVVWRKNKMGGPVAPVGCWLGLPQDREFDKKPYLELQQRIWSA